MNISSIKYIAKSNDSAVRWRCKSGVGLFRNSLILNGKSADLQNAARAVVFALGGRRYHGIEEVTLELTDNAGDTWEIWRGLNSTRFSHNGRMIPIDEAQRSMLAALLDMDPGISHGNGLVSPVLYRILTYRNGVFASTDALNGHSQAVNEPDPEMVIKMLVDECTKLTGRAEFANADAISKLATGLVSLRARWSEVQSAAGARPATGDVAPSIGLIESITRELDHLQQIDFLCRRMTDVHESIPRLTSQLDAIDESATKITSRWSKHALDAGLNAEEWDRGMECLVRVRAYSRLADTAVKLQRLSAKRLKPAAEKSMDHWNQFLFDSRVTGQEVESCLASMLLGMKQLGLDLDKLERQSEKSEPSARRDAPLGWFDRLKGKAETTDSLQTGRVGEQHVDWLQKSVRDVESLKASIEYALKSVQAFSDEFETAKSETTKEFGLLDELALKSLDELTKLKEAWSTWAAAADIPAEISLEDYVSLARDAHDIHILELRRADLQTRLAERVDLQHRLETHVRQWWNMIGSDKVVDISNPAFLVAEARAALRHRDTRRQRVHKLIKDAARYARDESLLQWNYKRRTEILAQWNEAFSSLGLPTIEMDDERIEGLVRLGSAIYAMKQLQAIREQSMVTRTDVWGPKDECPVRLYLWDQNAADQVASDTFVEMVSKFPSSKDSALTFLLVSDEETARKLNALGCGRAILAEENGSGSPIRSGAEHAPVVASKAEVPVQSGAHRQPQRDAGGTPAKNNKSTSPRATMPRTDSDLSQRAAAALKLLNPKSSRG